jgi:hypothetical protein
MGYKLEQVEAIASKLRALPAIEPPPKDLTKQEVVKMLAKEIKSLQKRGYTLEQIASSLKDWISLHQRSRAICTRLRLLLSLKPLVRSYRKHCPHRQHY